MSDEFNMQTAMSRLRTGHLAQYLRSNGWEQAESRYDDRVYFLGPTHAGGRYDLYLPTAIEVPKYQTLLQRAIYKLCGIEDREPSEILEDIFAALDQVAEDNGTADPPAAKQQRYRIRNTGQSALAVHLVTRDREYQLLPDEAVEVVIPTADVVEIERADDRLTIREA